MLLALVCILDFANTNTNYKYFITLRITRCKTIKTIMCAGQFRFHNSIQLNRGIYSNNGQRVDITNVQPSNSGEYTCRANSDGRGIYSNVATLSIRGMISIVNHIWHYLYAYSGKGPFGARLIRQFERCFFLIYQDFRNGYGNLVSIVLEKVIPSKNMFLSCLAYLLSKFWFRIKSLLIPFLFILCPVSLSC